MVEKFDKGQMEKKHPTPEQLSAFVAGFLGGDEKTQVEDHLLICKDCRQIVKDAARTDRETGGGKNDENVN